MHLSVNNNFAAESRPILQSEVQAALYVNTDCRITDTFLSYSVSYRILIFFVIVLAAVTAKKSLS